MVDLKLLELELKVRQLSLSLLQLQQLLQVKHSWRVDWLQGLPDILEGLSLLQDLLVSLLEADCLVCDDVFEL